jgi:hypothetical protein
VVLYFKASFRVTHCELEIKRELRRAGIQRASRHVYEYLSSYGVLALNPKIKKAKKNMLKSARMTLMVKDFSPKPMF